MSCNSKATQKTDHEGDNLNLNEQRNALIDDDRLSNTHV